MTEDWGFFERRTKQEQMRILVNSGWKEDVPRADYTELLSVTVNLVHLMDNKSTKRDTVKALERLESRLDEALSANGAAVYVGRINTTNRLEFYYYVSQDKLGPEQISALEQELNGYRIQFYLKSDPDWETYSFMLPNALEEMFIHNAQMVYTLIHKGDQIDRPRQVYHWLMFRRSDDRKEMKTTAEKLGYRIEESETPEEAQPGYPYSLVLSRWENVRLETVNERVRELHPLIQQLGGKYDGWGSVMKLSLYQRCKLLVKRLFDAAPYSRQQRNLPKD